MAQPSPKPPVERQTSAGGVVYRRDDGGVRILLVAVGPHARWQLPKGMIEAGESPEAAAVREVSEEGGVIADIVAPLQTIDYWYQSHGKDGSLVRYHKFVHFFLMEYRSGDLGDHDDEVTDARWIEIAEAESMLAFRGERSLIAEARALLT